MPLLMATCCEPCLQALLLKATRTAFEEAFVCLSALPVGSGSRFDRSIKGHGVARSSYIYQEQQYACYSFCVCH